MMGKRGPKKTPTNILKMRDSWRAKDRPDKEPLPAFKPRCPGHLNKHAKVFWKKYMPVLLKYGLMTEPDIEFEALCAAYGAWRMAYDTIEKMGGFPLYKAPDKVVVQKKRDGTEMKTTVPGMLVEHPALRSRDKSWEQFRRACADFGCNPSARAGIEIKAPIAKKGGKDRFFDKKFGQETA